MLQLIRKDVMLQKNTLLIMLPLLVVYIALNASATILSGVLFTIAITMQSFMLDEKRQIHILFNSLPYTRKEIVTSKYIGVFCFTGLVLLTILIANLVIHGESPTWKELLFILCLTTLFFSFSLPFSYRFKSQYLLFASIGTFAAYLVVINVFIPNLHDLIREVVAFLLAMEQVQLYVLVGCALVIVYILSWLLSIRIYEKKMF
ncbi:ABC-2 transporter permease [Paenibacillus sp. FSL W7-1287]|uniref:ABC-2 transporter permease n=1 Tax=Paenibacillus sp. FSL W7-1287 TaxID=2954538 RepID=UPI0030FCB1CB